MFSIYSGRIVAFLFILFSFTCVIAHTQSDENVIQLLESWEVLYEKNDFEQAATEASKAFAEAEKLNNQILMATALNREGRALIKMPNRVHKNRKEARKKFKESLALLTHIQKPKLRLNNFEQLKWLADQSNSSKVAQVYQDQIEKLTVIIASQKVNKSLQNEAQQLEKKINDLGEQKQVLTQKIKTLTTSQLESELLISLQKTR